MVENIISVDFETLSQGRDMYKKKKIDESYDKIYTKKSLHKLLNIFKEYDTKATFFLLGSDIEHNPDFLEKIFKNGHEIAVHGYNHNRLDEINKKIFTRQIVKTIEIIKDNIGVIPKGYRAPQYSMSYRTRWALEALVENGFKYDSSIISSNFSFYGGNIGPSDPYYPSLIDPSKKGAQRNIFEFPVLSKKIHSMHLPIGGGFWLRFFGSKLVSSVIKKRNEQQKICTIYIHNWELMDPPTIDYKRIHGYRNFGIPMSKQLEYLLKKHKFASMRKAYDIITK